jgi:predicted Zn finger-like uncharacterized protein
MLIACPKCETSYEVTPSAVGTAGRSVRCARCRHVWFVSNSDALADIARAHWADVAALTGTAPPAASVEPREASSQPIPDYPPATDFAAAEPGFDQPPPPAEQATAPAWPADTPALAADMAPPLSPELPEPATTAPEPLATVESPALAPRESRPQAPLRSKADDIETAARRRARREAISRLFTMPKPGFSAAILALIAVNLALIGWRGDVVRRFPQTASLYAALGLPVNLRGLVFTDVTTDTESQDGVRVLIVEGRIANAANRMVEVPRLRYAVRTASGQELYAWTALPPHKVLAPGQAMEFRTRLAAPPAEGTSVLVRFFNRRDLIADNK